jgi:hypothetical protein
MVVLTIAPIAFYYELGRFLMPKLQAGNWEWWVIAMGGALAACAVVDLANGRYGPFRKSPQQLLPPLSNWEDGLPRPD